MSLTKLFFLISCLLLSRAGSEPKPTQSTHLDIVFVLDTTGSMSSYIEQTKEIIESTISKYLENNQNVKFGIVAYRDFPPQDNTYITKIQDLNDKSETISFLRSLNAAGGGDFPEAVLKGLYDGATKIQWRNLQDDGTIKYKKVIIHAGDAPPHGEIFGGLSNWENGEPTPEGKTLDEVAKELNQHNIHYVFCKITDETNVMETMFKKMFTSYQLLDNSMKPENKEEDKKEFKKYRHAHGKYAEKLYDDYESLPKAKKEALTYEAKVTNYMLEL